MVNGALTALACALPAADTQAQDLTHAVAVVAGDDVCLSVNVQPFGSGVGYPMAYCVEFEGAQQFYGVAPAGGTFAPGNTQTAGAFGNGIFQILSVPTALSNTYSICTTPGTITGLRMKTYSGAPGAGIWTAYVTKNQVLQDGTGGTVNTACVLTGALLQAAHPFALPVAVGDHLDLALTRAGTTALFAVAHVAVSVTFTPTDAVSFMACGGNNDANQMTAVDWKWTQSYQQSVSEAVAQCPIGPRGIVVLGLYVEVPTPPAVGRSRTFVLRQNATDTAAAFTIRDLATSGLITGLSLPFVDRDLIDLQITPSNNPIVGNGLKWGLALVVPADAPPPPPPSYTVEARAIRRLRRAPHIAQENTRVFYRRFELDLERGQGLADGQGADPLVLLRLSRDGGQTWGEELRLPAGRLGDYTARVIARRLGQARDTVFEVVVSDPIAWSLVGAWLDLDPGTT
jgi:hypothetical protein